MDCSTVVRPMESARIARLICALGLAAAVVGAGCGSGSAGTGNGTGGQTRETGGVGGGQGGSNASGGSTSKGGAGGAGGLPAQGGAAGSGSVAPAITDVDGSLKIGSLSPTDATMLCNDTYTYFDKELSQADLCKWAGLAYGVSSSASSDAILQRNCKSQESACQQSNAAAAKCSAVAASCAVTVSQYSACIVAEAAAFNQALKGLPSCAAVTLPDLSGVWDYLTADLPDACTSITNKCEGYDVPAPRPPSSSPGAGGSGGATGSGGTGTSTGAGGAGGTTNGTGGKSTGGAGGGSGGSTRANGSGGSGGSSGLGGAGGTILVTDGLPGDVAKAAGTPFVAAHAMTRALFASYAGPLFKALRDSDKEEKDIGIVTSTGLVDMAALNWFCSGTTCKVTTLYDQSGNGNDMWRGDVATNAPMDNGETPKLCDLLAIEYMSLSDGSKLPIAVETGSMWKSKAQCLRNRDKTKNMPTGASPETTYAIFHAKYLNNNCCFNYGNTGKRIHYTGPGTLSALNFSKIEFWSKGTGSGPWVMVDWEQGVYAGNTAKCGSGAAPTADCTTTGENPNPSITFDVVTALFKHDGTQHWAMKAGNAKSGNLAVSVDLSTLPKGYSPLKQEGGLGLGEGGAGDTNGTGGFSEGAVMAAETTDAVDNAIQKSIVSVYGK